MSTCILHQISDLACSESRLGSTLCCLKVVLFSGHCGLTLIKWDQVIFGIFSKLTRKESWWRRLLPCLIRLWPSTCDGPVHVPAQYMCRPSTCDDLVHVMAYYMWRPSICDGPVHVMVYYMWWPSICDGLVQVTAYCMWRPSTWYPYGNSCLKIPMTIYVNKIIYQTGTDVQQQSCDSTRHKTAKSASPQQVNDGSCWWMSLRNYY